MILFLFLLVLGGVGVFLVEQYVPMSPPFKVALRVAVVLALLWQLLAVFGFVPALPRRY